MTSVLVKIDKNKLFRYEIIRATRISFFILLWGIKVGIERKYILHSWVADQSTGFLLARGSYLNVQTEPNWVNVSTKTRTSTTETR